MLLQTATIPVSACEECARHVVGPELAAVLAVLVPLAWAAIQRHLAAKKAEANVLRVKAERNALRAAKQTEELARVRAETRLDSLSPPAFPRPSPLGEFTPTPTPVIVTLPPSDLQSVPPSEPPRDMAGDPVDEALETADTVPPRGRK
jgi:hypothetical protein